MLRFKGADVHRVLAEARDFNCNLAFVKGFGVYLLALNGDHLPNGERRHRAYAIGCNPTVDPIERWWSRACTELEGDDVVEYLDPRDPVLRYVWETGGDLLILVTETHLGLTARMPTNLKR